MNGSTRVKITKPVIGWREWISMPDLGLVVKAKIDTGATSSALHAFDIEHIQRNGRPHVCFKVHPVQREVATTVTTEAPLVGETVVRDSSGKTTLRPIIETTLQLGDSCWPIQITLTRRDVMGFRMLIGRRAIRRRFLVDPGRSFLIGKGPRPASRDKTKHSRRSTGD